MTDDLKHDLSGYRLADHEHLSGCPAKPERQEAEVVRRPPARGLVQSGVAADGEAVYEPAARPGEQMVRARCCDCGAQRLFEMVRDGD